MTTGGVTTLNVGDSSASSADTGRVAIIVGMVSGKQASIEDPIIAVSGSNETLAYALPFADLASGTQNITIGTDNTGVYSASGQGIGGAFFWSLFASGKDNISLSVPVGYCLTHLQTHAPANLIGYGKLQSHFVAFPGESFLDMTGGTRQQIANFSVQMDHRIDPTAPGGWYFYDTTGTQHPESQTYRPFMRNTAAANDPLGPGWILGSGPNGSGALNGVASVTAGSPTITITSPTAPTNESQIIFPYLSTIFKTTVTCSGTTCTLGANWPGSTGTLQEWFAGTSIQTTATALTAGQTFSATSPITINLTNSIAPSPCCESNFAGFGVMKIGAQHFSYVLHTWPNAGQVDLIASPEGNTVLASTPSGSAIAPVNPSLFDAAPWPVLGMGALTPANAGFFPAYNAGAYAFGSDCYDGNTCGLTGGGPFEGAFMNLGVLDDWPLGDSYSQQVDDTTTDFYWVKLTYATHFYGLDLYGASCFVENLPSINTHGAIFGGPTADGSTASKVSCHNSLHGVTAAIISGGKGGFYDWNTYGGGAGPGFPAGLGFNLYHGLDDQTGGVIQQAGATSAMNIYHEPGGLEYGFGVGMENDCIACQLINWNYSGGGAIIDGGFENKYIAGNLGTVSIYSPFINYGTLTELDNVAGFGNENFINQYGSSHLMDWGPGLMGCVTYQGGEGPCVSIGNSVAKSLGATNETFNTGNIAVPYDDSLGGFIRPLEMNGVHTSLTGGWTFDLTEPKTDSYASCNVGTSFSTYCNLQDLAGTAIGLMVGNHQRVTNGLYELYADFKETSTTAQHFGFEITSNQSGDPFAPTCVNNNQVIYNNTSVPVTNSWNPQDLGRIDLTNYAGCQLIFQYNQASTAATTIQTGYIDLAPVAANPNVQSISLQGTTPTEGSACSKSQTLLAINGGYVYVCDGGTVKRVAVN